MMITMNSGIKYCGIDLGKKGAIAMLNELQELVYCSPIPVIKSSKSVWEYDLNQIVKIFRLWKPNFTMIEQPLLLGVSGKKSYFNSGFALGLFQGIILTHELKQDKVIPRIWQKNILGSFNKGDSKQASIQFAQLQFPAYDFRVGKNYHDGKTDAVCLALYCYRKYNGVQ